MQRIKTVSSNKDNDRKYSEGLFDDNESSNNNETNLNESENYRSRKIEYFTE